MSEKQRRWFQIHLSTAVVVMLTAGALLFIGLFAEEHLRKNLWRDDERVSPVSLRSSGIITIFDITFAFVALMILFRIYRACEQRIERKEN